MRWRPMRSPVCSPGSMRRSPRSRRRRSAPCRRASCSRLASRCRRRWRGDASPPLIPVAPGVRVGRVEVPEDPSSTVLLLRIGPGRSIPDHTHTGNEFTQVISGAFRDASGRYGPGDLAEADGEVDHSPVVEEGAECVCIAAFEGRLRFHGLLGVALRPFI